MNENVATKAILPDALKADQGGDQPLAEAVAKYYYKLLAYKDEFEVAFRGFQILLGRCKGVYI